MKIAVVTPYYKETDEQLSRCHLSVRAQTVPCDHILVSDGFPQDQVDTWDCTHIKLPNHADYGDTPRLIGTASATTLGYEAILLLDGDNWFEPNHVETLLGLAVEAGADVVTCARMLIRSDTLGRIGTDTESNGREFNDTNCYLVMRRAFPLFRAWAFKDPALGIVGDRVFWNALQTLPLKLAHSPLPTVNYVTTFAFHYLSRGLVPPVGAKDIVARAEGGWTMMGWEEALAYRRALIDAHADLAATRLASQGGTAKP